MLPRSAVAGAAAVVAAVAVGRAVAQGPGQCAADYDCKWTYVDQYSAVYSFDFSPLCNTKGVDYAVNDTGGHTFLFNICGYANFRCLPQGYVERYQYGSAIQVWDTQPPCDQTNQSTMCYSQVDQKYECCTQNCEVVGVGTPIWSLIDPTNPTRGGVKLMYSSVPPLTGDGNTCGQDPNTLAPIARSVTFNMACARGVIGKDLVIYNVTEPSTCQYVINAASPMACGCESQCFVAGKETRNCGLDGCGGTCSPPNLEGECPYANQIQQVCDYDTGTCCRPDCAGRQCGDDGCGGTCGTCGAGESCTAYQVCVPNPAPPKPQFAIQYAVDAGGLAGSFIGGIVTAFAVAFAIVFFFRGGRDRFDSWRYAGGSGGGALLAAKTAGGAGGAAPSIAGAASSGGYGSASLSSGGGGYGSTQ